VVLIARPNNIEFSVCVRKWVVLIRESNCESVKTSDYIVDLQNKNNKNDRWLFIVTLQQSIRLKVFSSLVKIYSTTYHLHWNYTKTYFGTTVHIKREKVTFWMGQVTFIRSLVPDKWWKNKFGEPWSGHYIEWSK